MLPDFEEIMIQLFELSPDEVDISPDMYQYMSENEIG
jgi:hypothetical protein